MIRVSLITRLDEAVRMARRLRCDLVLRNGTAYLCPTRMPKGEAMEIEELERRIEAEAQAAQQRGQSQAVYHAVRADALQYQMRRLAEELAARERELARLERRLQEAQLWQQAGEALAFDWPRLYGVYGNQALACLHGHLLQLVKLYRRQQKGGSHE